MSENFNILTNEELLPKVSARGTIDIIPMTKDNLTTIGWLDAKGNPTEQFKTFITDMDFVVPTDFGHEVKYWDTIQKSSFMLFNHFLEDGNND